MIQDDLLFQDSAPTLRSESDSDSDDRIRGDSGEPGEGSDVEEFTWDGLLIEDEDEEAMYTSN
jgi:hypothetical protein